MFFFILTVLNPLSVGTALLGIQLTAESSLMVVNSFSFKRYQVDENCYFSEGFKFQSFTDKDKHYIVKPKILSYLSGPLKYWLKLDVQGNYLAHVSLFRPNRKITVKIISCQNILSIKHQYFDIPISDNGFLWNQNF